MNAQPGRGRRSRAAATRITSGTRRLDAEVEAAFQPIEDLRAGEIIGYEALARLRRGERMLHPAEFLPTLSEDGLTELFQTMLGQALSLRKSLIGDGPGFYVSVNVEVPLVLSDGFVDLLSAVLDQHAPIPNGALVLELLEDHATSDFARMSERLHAIRALGIRVALDDIGSAYSSLINLRDLPVDIMKLDRSFARGLGENPRDLHFVLSLQSLAHSIGKRLVVEGVETGEILDALRILGVDFGQGYGIARPMAAGDVRAWMAGRPLKHIGIDGAPTSLLGAYAGHLRLVEACRTLMSQPLPVTWTEASKDPHACSLGIYFDRCGMHGSSIGRAHKRFHEVITLCGADPVIWHQGAENLRQELERALTNPDLRFACEAIEEGCSYPSQ